MHILKIIITFVYYLIRTNIQRMYIIVEKEPLKVVTFEAKTDLAKYLNLHPNTINYRFSKKPYWETEKETVYQSNKHHKRLRRGNNDSFATKKLKRNS